MMPYSCDDGSPEIKPWYCFERLKRQLRQFLDHEYFMPVHIPPVLNGIFSYQFPLNIAVEAINKVDLL